MATTISRRQFLATSAAVGAATLLPSTTTAGTNVPSGGGPYWDRFLILIELDGGNDGLNTVIPFDVPEYKGTGSVPSRRPGLKYTLSSASPTYLGTASYATANAAVGTTQPFALNPAMTHLKAAWNPSDPANHDLAIVLGVGYADPNLSHFRSMDIWNGGCNPNEYPSNNWLGRLFAQSTVAATVPSDLTAHAVLLSRYSSNPLRSAGVRYLAMSKPDEFVRRSLSMAPATYGGTTSPHLQHLLTTWNEVNLASGDFRDSLMTLKASATVGSTNGSDYLYTPAAMTGSGITFNLNSDFEKRCLSIAQMIATNRSAVTDPTKRLKIPVYKVQIGGFDNHSTQKAKHEDLLAQVSSAMASLRAALKLHGLWDRALIMTYSEFGRRVEENGSAGTDHGTANCHFLLGGGIQGGFYGAQPGLSKGAGLDLDSRGNLVANVDYRNLYATAATWLGLPYASDPYMGGASPLACFA
jgi:uncharacterized protein (DUF1501 family)